MRIILFLISIPAKLMNLLGRGYGRLSNRFIAFVTLLLTVPLIGYGLYFVFGLNIGSITFVSVENGREFSLLMEKGGIPMIERTCKSECTVEGIPASTYTVKLSSAGRKEIRKDLRIQRGDALRDTIVWETSLSIESVAATKLSEITPSITVESDPLRLIDQNKKTIYQSVSAIGYSTGSLAYGYFMSVLPNGAYDIVNIQTGEVFVLAPTNTQSTDVATSTGAAAPLIINYIKPLGTRNSYIVSTKWETYTYSRDTEALEPLTLYDDLLITPNGELITLLRAQSTAKRELLWLNNREGDLILNATRVGVPQILKDKLSDSRALFLKDGEVFLDDTMGQVSKIIIGEGGDGSETSTNQGE